MRIAFELPDSAVAAIQRHVKQNPSSKLRAVADIAPPPVKLVDNPGTVYSAMLEAVAYIVQAKVADPAQQQRIMNNAMNRFHREHPELFKTVVGVRPLA